MDEESVLSIFDGLVNSGMVHYDDKQVRLNHTEGELQFQFLLTSALAKKPTVQASQIKFGQQEDRQYQERDGSDIHTDGFEIGNVGGGHFMIANKFCFARPHLMLLTSDGHRRQYERLQEGDLEAVWTVLTTLGGDYAAFYNCGQDAGCSRLHKHLQVIPTPEDSFAAFLDVKDRKEPRLPFQWFYHKFGEHGVHTTPSDLAEVYIKLLDQATEVGEGLSQHAVDTPLAARCPHNVILTKRWMIVIPRRQAGINKQAGVNAIGMLGLIAVATKDEIDSWMRFGPTQALRVVGVPQ